MAFDDVGLRVEVKRPDVLQQHGAGDDLASVSHEVLEQLELLRLKIDGLARPRGVAFQKVDLKLTDTDLGQGLGEVRPTGEGVYACDQLGHGEGFDEVVVSAGFQPFDPVLDTVHGGQEYGRRGDAGNPQGLERRHAINAGDHAVDDKHVIGAVGGVKARIAPRGAGIHHMSGGPQPFLYEGGGLRVVLKEKNLHASLPFTRVADPLAERTKAPAREQRTSSQFRIFGSSPPHMTGGRVSVEAGSPLTGVPLMSRVLATAAGLSLAISGLAFAQAAVPPAAATPPTYVGANLASKANITIAQARVIALKAHPGQITDQELENEGGGSGLRYSFDVKSGGKTHEVGVDAKTGRVLENKAEGPHPD